MTASSKVAVLGAGSWGTALAIHMAEAGHMTRLWARSPAFAAELRGQRENRTYLPGAELPPSLGVVDDLAAVTDCDQVLLVVPSHGFRSVLHDFLPLLGEDQQPTLVSATKGIESESLLRMSEVCRQEGLRVGRQFPFAVLSGPSFAEEMVRGYPTAAVIAAVDETLVRGLQASISEGNLRLYSSTDVVGVELGGTVKNIVAIASGVVTGLGLGANTRAALITRGLHEMTRLGVACGGEAATFSGLAGLGDLVLTCTSTMSRNFRLGESLASGGSLADFEQGPSVAEGAKNSKAILGLARRLKVEMPITEQMVAVLYEGKSPEAALDALMARTLKTETGT